MFDTLTRDYPFLQALMEDVAEVSQYLWQKGWAERNAGNISVRITGQIKFGDLPSHEPPVFQLPMRYPGLGGEVFFMTGTGRRMRDVKRFPEKNTLIIVLDTEGTSYRILSHTAEHLRDLRPTSELSSHLSIHQYLNKEKPAKKAVLHSHPDEIIALSHMPGLTDEKNLNRVIWGMHPEAVVFLPAGAAMVPYQVTGSNELGKETLQALRYHDVVIWEKHGCLAVAEGIGEAFDLMDIVNKSADIYLKCRAAGFEPEGLSEEQINKLK